MPLRIDIPNRDFVLEARPLTQEGFHHFGTVIENPQPCLIPSPSVHQLPSNAVLANQGSAIKHVDVTKMVNLYDQAPSKVASKAVINMFVCAPRALLPLENGKDSVVGLFPVEVLERHPFTTQTFIPLGLSPLEETNSCYLIIVAPSLPPSQLDDKLPVPDTTADHPTLPGRGAPDLERIQAFICRGSQAVTYGAGTWHAPMVAIGSKHIDFVVVQFANNVDIEDCQEVELKTDEGRLGVKVAIPGEQCGPAQQSKL
ncbi:ureidoglycolate hydrolase-like protein [Xylogone sp. PMI_703]|nr:ureidoglycolate hydrolase-like protein [Xylogone sp. PMI_703]